MFKISTSCINVFFSGRWADVFSAKGCKDTPEHKFSHPFVQVQCKAPSVCFFYSTKASVYHGSDQTVCCNMMSNNIMKYRQLVLFFFFNLFVVSHFLSFNQGNVLAIFYNLGHFVKMSILSPSLCVCPTPSIPGSGHVSG